MFRIFHNGTDPFSKTPEPSRGTPALDYVGTYLDPVKTRPSE